MFKDLNYAAYKVYIAQRFGIPMDEIADQSDFIVDFGMDSLGLFSLIEDIENDYGLKLAVEELLSKRTVIEVFEHIQNKVTEKV